MSPESTEKKDQEQSAATPKKAAPDFIMNADGKPFSSARAAAFVLQQRKDELNPEDWEIVQLSSSEWILAKKKDLQAAVNRMVPDGQLAYPVGSPDVAGPAVQADEVEEGFRRVRFHAKHAEHQPDWVELSVNGDTLQIKREAIVTLPNRFIECARNGVFPHYKQLPGVNRKVVARIQHYPFDDLGPGTAEEYRTQREEGTRAQKDKLSEIEQPA